MSRRNLSLLVAVFFVSIVCYSRGRQNPYARYVADGFEAIDTLSLDPPANEELVAGAMRGMVDVLRRRGDEHSRYLRPRAAEQLLDELRGGFGGVGVRIRLLGDPPQLTVIGPPEPGGPAYRGGVKAGDHIIAIDEEPTDGMSMDDVLDLMRGEVGEPLLLSVVRGEDAESEPISIRLIREIISVPSVVGDRRLKDGTWQHLLEQDGRIALVRIQTFGDRTVSELRQLVPELQSAGMRAMVLDLRENPGGSLDAAVAACEMFLPPNADIVETRERGGKLRQAYVGRGGPYTDFPITVLVNGNSASASEIMASCFQDNKRAVVVGQRSFGKGTVQQMHPLGPADAMLKLTVARYWRPSGKNIHRGVDDTEEDDWGVSPNEGYEVAIEEDRLLEWRLARSERDLIPIDETTDTQAADKSSPATEPASPDEQAPGEETFVDPWANEPPHTDHHAEPETPAPYTDEVLDRAVEYLQSLLDGNL